MSARKNTPHEGQMMATVTMKANNTAMTRRFFIVKAIERDAVMNDMCNAVGFGSFPNADADNHFSARSKSSPTCKNGTFGMVMGMEMGDGDGIEDGHGDGSDGDGVNYGSSRYGLVTMMMMMVMMMVMVMEWRMATVMGVMLCYGDS